MAGENTVHGVAALGYRQNGQPIWPIMGGDGRDDAGAAGPQAGTAAQPQAGTTTGGQEPPAGTGQAPAAGTQSGADDGETAEAKAARLERENADLRKEQAANRTKLRTLEAAQRDASAATQTDKERADALATEKAALEVRLKDQAVRTSAATAASRLGFRNPDVAYRLLDQGSLTFDDEGQPTNTDKLLEALLKAEPYLGKGAGADYGGGTRGATPGTAPDMNDLLRAAFGKG